MVILQLLRHHTSAMHQQREQRLDVLRPDLTRADYLSLLQGFSGWYIPLETQLFTLEGWSSFGIDLHARSKVPLRCF